MHSGSVWQTVNCTKIGKVHYESKSPCMPHAYLDLPTVSAPDQSPLGSHFLSFFLAFPLFFDSFRVRECVHAAVNTAIGFPRRRRSGVAAECGNVAPLVDRRALLTDSLCISALTSRRYQRKEQQRLCDLFSSQDQEWDSIEYLDGVLVPSLFRFVFQKETCHVLTTWIWPRTGPVCTVYLNQLIVIGLLSILCILGYLWHYQWRRLRRQPLWTPECCSRGHWCRLCAGFVLDETTLPVWKPQASQNNIKSLQMIGSCGFLSFSQQCHIISLLLWWLRTASANALLCSVLF